MRQIKALGELTPFLWVWGGGAAKLSNSSFHLLDTVFMAISSVFPDMGNPNQLCEKFIELTETKNSKMKVELRKFNDGVPRYLVININGISCVLKHEYAIVTLFTLFFKDYSRFYVLKVCSML